MADEAHQENPISLFYSYSHRDEAFRGELEAHLSFLRRSKLIAEWHDRMIGAGTEWKGQIDQQLAAADIVLLLVSADFLASDYCWDEEMTKALARHQLGETRVIPVILRPCRWQRTPLGSLQAVPKDGKPVSEWPNHDAAFDEIATAIERTITDLQQQRRRAGEQAQQQTEEARKRAEAKARQETAKQREAQRREQDNARRSVETDAARAPKASCPPDRPTINCPYCPESFEISLRTADGKLLALEDAEIEALPYARDIDAFDPDPREEGRNNSSFTKIGTDFFGGLNYERIGILHMEPGWDVHYCVARCTKCKMLIDVFVNLTRDQRLGDIWPHLLRRSPDKDHHIILWRPTDIIDRIFGQPVLVFVLLLLLFGGSLAPQLMSSTVVQTPSEADRLAEQLVPALITRFIVLVTAFALVCLRSGIIGVFSDYKWSDLFLVKRELIAYWSNFAVCRFAGYQKNGNFATPNAVMVLGGLSSFIVFLLVWTIVNFNNVRSFSYHDVLPFITLTAFWCVISYICGVLVWSLSVVSVYVFRGLKNIPMQVESGYTIREFKLIERAQLYATSGVAVLTAGAIALSMLPIFVAPFAELTAALIWAQGALIVCFSILVIRFGIWHEQDVFKKSAGIVKLGGMIALFLGVRTGIGLPEASGFLIHWIERLPVVPSGDNRKYAEVVVFSFIAAYLFYRLTKDVLGREIRESALKNAWRQLNDDRNQAIYAGDLDKAAEMRKLSPLSLEGEKPANRRLQFVAAFFSVVGAIVPLIEWALKHLGTGK